MKILLFSPLITDQYHIHYKNKLKAFLHSTVLRATYHKSLALEMLSAVTPKEHEVVIKKTNYDNAVLDEKYDLVGIHCVTGDSPFAYKVADRFRDCGVTVFLGGYHPSALPEEAKQHADAVVIGEAEETWPLLLKDFENGKLKSFYKQTNPIDGEKIPSQIETNHKDFFPAIQASRGCPYQCEFCSETIINCRKIFRPRPIKNVIEEIKLLPGKSFIFHDPSLTIDPEYAKNLFKKMMGLNKHFFCNGNVDTLCKDDKLLILARQAGCLGWLVGFESISKESLDSVKKKTNKIENYSNAVEKIHDNHMMVCGTFVFGFDGDTIDVFRKTKEFVEESGIDVPDALILTPFPGTPLYNRLEKEKRILTKDWTRYDHKHVVFQPKNMTPEELLENTYNLYKEFFTIGNSIKRTIKSINLDYYAFKCVLFSSLTMRNVEMNVDVKI